MKFSDMMRKQATVSVLFALAFGMAGSAFAADDYNLRTLAVTNADGSLKVLYHGSNAWWNATGEYAPFDGDTTTFIDPMRIYAPTWVGYELTEPRVVTRIRFAVPHKTDIEDRLRGCRVEGANEPDFSDAVVLLDVRSAVPEHWLTGSPYWVEAPARGGRRSIQRAEMKVHTTAVTSRSWSSMALTWSPTQATLRQPSRTR